MALPQANSPNAMILGSVATRSTAGCLPNSIGAPAMPPDLSRGFAYMWMASRISSMRDGGPASRMTA